MAVSLLVLTRQALLLHGGPLLAWQLVERPGWQPWHGGRETLSLQLLLDPLELCTAGWHCTSVDRQVQGHTQECILGSFQILKILLSQVASALSIN